MKRYSILLVDDDKKILDVYAKILELNEFSVITAENAKNAVEIIKKNEVSVVISDVIMPKTDGIELLKKIKYIKPDIETIMLTAEGSISGAVEAVKEGAFSYIVKPADIAEMISCVKKAEELFLMKNENKTLKQRLDDISTEKRLIGVSPVAESLIKKAQVIGNTDSAVHITGESGTGKEVFANLIHRNSMRNKKPFICINCGALNENLIEAELFGAEKGAYTGADKQRKGRFEIADGGTIFFDEIGELTMGMQVKLLRVLQEKSFERVGGTETIKSDFRLITATNRDLKSEVEKNRFREDLFYRINIIPVIMPPLRERKEDIELLCETFLEEFSIQTNKKIKPMDKKILDCFVNYDWPGNIRELRNIIERLVVLSVDGEIDIDELPPEIIDSFQKNEDESGLREMTKAFEKEYIVKTISKYGGNISKAAEEMHIARKNLYGKISKYNIRYKK